MAKFLHYIIQSVLKGLETGSIQTQNTTLN